MIEIVEKSFLETLPKIDSFLDGIYWNKPLKRFKDLLEIKNPEINEHCLILEESSQITYMARWVDEIKKWVIDTYTFMKGCENILKNELERVYLIYS